MEGGGVLRFSDCDIGRSTMNVRSLGRKATAVLTGAALMLLLHQLPDNITSMSAAVADDKSTPLPRPIFAPLESVIGVEFGQVVEFTVSATRTDGTQVRVRMHQSCPEGALFEEGRFRWSNRGGVVSRLGDLHSVMFIAEDQSGAVATKAVLIIVK